MAMLSSLFVKIAIFNYYITDVMIFNYFYNRFKKGAAWLLF
ncbi:hypothetical protein S3E15_00773 [Bacillus mycoides]|uniref:Uncharacterized protein n=1 Tax=Bacillus mycoides TaxID=1405 RepID=A0AAP8BDQ3_BACMY|nr:hypothetical protein S3E15_00773 [Bacillus mycoides]OSY05974.1 hypothetical protein BTJ44_02032 [Bacillus mycoides]OSY16375.1 hypothetical protein BTJ48_00184 [Bacillus mycoides]